MVDFAHFGAIWGVRLACTSDSIVKYVTDMPFTAGTSSPLWLRYYKLYGYLNQLLVHLHPEVLSRSPAYCLTPSYNQAPTRHPAPAHRLSSSRPPSIQLMPTVYPAHARRRLSSSRHPAPAIQLLPSSSCHPAPARRLAPAHHPATTCHLAPVNYLVPARSLPPARYRCAWATPSLPA